MHPQLQHDLDQLPELLRQTTALALDFLRALPERPAGASFPAPPPEALPSEGLGLAAALAHFQHRYGAGLSGSAGPRYWGFVTGGATPAALAGDWLTSTFDQNVFGGSEPAGQALERETLGRLRQLFGLSAAHAGAFVSGATMANVVGLALGRQWAARRLGFSAAEDGLAGQPALTVLSGTPHSSIYKALALLGLGRHSLRPVAVQPGREAVDLAALRRELQALAGRPVIVVGNAGTVNTADFDDLAGLAELKREFDFWLHVDGAFGGFAACAPRYRPLVHGLDEADSLTIDAHKWLNVPYDSAMQFTRRPDLQMEVFQNSGAYLGALTAEPDFVHLTPENSRRWRALPAWFTLQAYGAEGYQEIVERDCALAQALGERIAAAAEFELLAPVRLNVVCFTLAGRPSAEQVQAYLAALRATGAVFLTPTVYQGRPAIRAALSNWRTQPADVDQAWEALLAVAQRGGL